MSETKPTEWKTEGKLRLRSYPNYAAYLQHQAEKLGRITLEGYSSQFAPVLLARVAALSFLRRGMTVLCLGARNGVECRCFIQKGCVAIGIDLNPGVDNRYVVHGDFHDLQFADESFDVVFTNCLDHVLELSRVLGEVRRVLKPTGRFVAEICHGSMDANGREPGEYESAWWNSSADVIERISVAQFIEEERTSFDFPWPGDRVVFRRRI